MIVVATDAERKCAENRWPDDEIIVTGVGGLNVYKSLERYEKNTPILNFGYAGSNIIPIGTEVSVGKCFLLHPNVLYEEDAFVLGGHTTCFTSCDFVLETKIKDPVVFDMELAFIMAMGFTNVKSIKIVSDNLSVDEYESTIK